MDESRKAPRIEIQDIDHLGIVAGIVDEIGLVEEIDQKLGTHPQEHVSPGQTVKAMILNGLGFLSAPLYLFGEFFRQGHRASTRSGNQTTTPQRRSAGKGIGQAFRGRPHRTLRRSRWQSRTAFRRFYKERLPGLHLFPSAWRVRYRRRRRSRRDPHHPRLLPRPSTRPQAVRSGPDEHERRWDPLVFAGSRW